MMRKLIYGLILTGVILIHQTAPFAGELSKEGEDILTQALAFKGYEDAICQFNLRIAIPEIDGNEAVDLWGTLIKHAGDEPLPTILVATPYRREFLVFDALTLFPRGYNILCIDIRGTGSAEGTWMSFNEAEHKDVAFVIDKWIPKHPWSDGKVGMLGPSYMAIIQIMAAGNIEVDENGEPVHLKALFPIVPMADTYKDIVMHGGNLDLLFIPVWLLGVDLLAMMPSTLYLGGENAGMDGTWEDPDTHVIKEAGQNWLASVKQLQLNGSWFLEPENLVDNDFFDERSSMIYWPEKNSTANFGQTKTIPSKLPVFMVGGWYCIFTNGESKTYQYGLAEHDVKDKAMVIGPWYHLDGSFCLGVDGMMMFTNAVQARWFDWKIKGIEDPFMVEFPVALYIMGEDKWRAEKTWPLAESRVENEILYLSKQKAKYNYKDWFSFFNRKNDYKLTENITQKDYSKTDPVLKHRPQRNLQGMASRSMSRWFIGVPAIISQTYKYMFGKDVDDQVFYEDERLDEVGVLTFTTDPLKEDVEITGPMKLTFWAKTTFDDPLENTWLYKFLDLFFLVTNNDLDAIEDENNTVKMLTEEDDVQFVVEVNDVFPKGRAKNITSGWLRASHRPYDPDNVHETDPEYMAFDPFYDKADRNPNMINENEVYKYVVEVWPTDNVFKKGHRIRVSISASDFPHLLPIMVPCDNTILIDENHPAAFEFTSVNQDDEGVTWKWIEEEGKYDPLTNYLMNHKN
ncbi:MAG: CocE/NonD family hydrolase [Proteobacteria bacterium]|nr:CocE/NonD family hydrolase [Pseudomonadota bacterium]